MANPVASTRIPHSWDEQIKSIATETGQLPSDIVRDAIAQYLGKTNVDSVQSMSKRLAGLERQVKKLMQLM
jgi:predicted DNA-binding protein